jgi:hypothetical protein
MGSSSCWRSFSFSSSSSSCKYDGNTLYTLTCLICVSLPFKCVFKMAICSLNTRKGWPSLIIII